ncbi:MAG: hypothetical protein C4289_11985, partial [Chloroflexota bacterium]
MDELAGVLGRERRLLEVLLYKLVVCRQLLACGEARFLAWAAAEVERAVEKVREAELLRATLVARLAGELGVNIVDIEVAHSPEGDRGVLLLVVAATSADLLRGALVAR